MYILSHLYRQDQIYRENAEMSSIKLPPKHNNSGSSSEVSEDVHIAKKLQLYSFPMGPRRISPSPKLDSSPMQRSDYFGDSNLPSPTSASKEQTHRRSSGLSWDSNNSAVPSLDTDTTQRSSSGGFSLRTASSANNISQQCIPMTYSPTKTIDLSEVDKPLTPKSDTSTRSPQIPNFITQRSGSFTKMMDLSEEDDNHALTEGGSERSSTKSSVEEQSTDLLQFLQEPYDEKLVELVRHEMMEQKKQKMKDNEEKLSFLKMNSQDSEKKRSEGTDDHIQKDIDVPPMLKRRSHSFERVLVQILKRL